MKKRLFISIIISLLIIVLTYFGLFKSAGPEWFGKFSMIFHWPMFGYAFFGEGLGLAFIYYFLLILILTICFYIAFTIFGVMLRNDEPKEK